MKSVYDGCRGNTGKRPFKDRCNTYRCSRKFKADFYSNFEYRKEHINRSLNINVQQSTILLEYAYKLHEDAKAISIVQLEYCDLTVGFKITHTFDILDFIYRITNQDDQIISYISVIRLRRIFDKWIPFILFKTRLS